MNISANLKLDPNMSKTAKKCIIDDVLEVLGLSGAKGTRCGRLSGGEKKKLSIALELVNNPSIMFLDEPTTGLDIVSSIQCVRMLRLLARDSRNIICTIHQPSATIYGIFDHVYVIADGYCIYKGLSTNTIAYLSTIGLHCPEHHNVADYIIEVAIGEYGNFTERLTKMAEKHKWRSVCYRSKSKLQKRSRHEPSGNTLREESVIRNQSTEYTKFLVLLTRWFLQVHRDWTDTRLKLLVHIVIGIFIGIFYFNVGNDASKIKANYGYITLSCGYLCFTAVLPATVKFPLELPVLKKERFNNWYCLKTYYAAFMIVDVPIQMLLCALYTTISYYMTSQPWEWHRFLMFLVICCLLTTTAESVGIFIGTVFDPINGIFLSSVSVAVSLALSGFVAILSHMSKPFYFLSYISYIRYAFEGLMYSVYGQGRKSIPCPEDINYCHYATPQVFLKEMGLDNMNYWFSFGMLCCIIVFFRILTYYTLKIRISSNI